MTATVVVLVLAAIVPLVTAVYAVGGHRRMVDDRRRTVRALRRLQAVIDECRTWPDSATDSVVVGLTDVLHLKACRFEDVARTGAVVGSGDELPVLRADGDIGAKVLVRRGSGLVLPARAALPAGTGRFVLDGDPRVGTTVEERVIAAAMAALVGTIVDAAAVELVKRRR